MHFMHADTHTMRVLRWDWAFVYRGGHTRDHCYESRDTRPRVSGTSNIGPSDTPGGVSLQRYLTFWQSSGTMCEFERSTRRFPRASGMTGIGIVRIRRWIQLCRQYRCRLRRSEHRGRRSLRCLWGIKNSTDLYKSVEFFVAVRSNTPSGSDQSSGPNGAV